MTQIAQVASQKQSAPIGGRIGPRGSATYTSDPSQPAPTCAIRGLAREPKPAPDSKSNGSKFQSSLHAEMLATIPKLRTFARALTRSWDLTDELVQQTMLQACDKFHLYEPGSNMTAWLITILKNTFYKECRRRRREVEDADGGYAETLVAQAAQVPALQFEDLRQALERLPQDLRDTVILICVRGFSYDETARIFGCPVGTVKSRLSRARARLVKMLSVEGWCSFGSDPIHHSVLHCLEAGRLNHDRRGRVG